MRFWQNVENTERGDVPSTDSQVYRFPGKAVARLHDEIMELLALHDQQQARIDEAKARLQQIAEDTERTVRDAAKVQAELNDKIEHLRDNWRRVTSELGVEVLWPERRCEDD